MTEWRPDSMAVYGMLTASIVTAGLLMRIVAGMPFVVGPIGFVLMYFAAYLANFLGRDIIIPSLEAFQRGIAFSFCGQVFGALLVLQLFKIKEGHQRRF